MSTLKAQQAGGRATAIKLRNEALKKYYDNPSICLLCGEIILVTKKVRHAKDKKFCNKSHAATYNNRKFPRKKTPKPKLPKLQNQKIKKSYKPRKPREYKESKIASVTKGELFKIRKNYQSARSTIRKHAEKIYKLSNKPTACQKCDYSIHIEICHIKEVSSFHENTTISEINHPDNLIGLCPTHHWELDNGYIEL